MLLSAGDAELVPCKRGGVQVLGIAPCHGDAALKMHDLPRSTLPGPGPCESAELGWRNVPPVDLQRRCSSHGEALSGVFRAPYADVLFEPFWPEPELRSLERRFERDLDLPVLEWSTTGDIPQSAFLRLMPATVHAKTPSVPSTISVISSRRFTAQASRVILDVVYNRTAEGNAEGPTLCFRGLANEVYYILDPGRARYANYSGTRNTLNANQSIVRRMILDSARYWVTEMHLDGFRFHLASILARDETARPLENPPVLWDIESDPVLAGIKQIAEAWDAAGFYQVGSFIGDSWKEWNGRFRDVIRAS